MSIQLEIPDEVKNVIQDAQFHALIRCMMDGHDFRSIHRFQPRVCVCCGYSEDEIDGPFGVPKRRVVSDNTSCQK